MAKKPDLRIICEMDDNYKVDMTLRCKWKKKVVETTIHNVSDDKEAEDGYNLFCTTLNTIYGKKKGEKIKKRFEKMLEGF